MWLASDWPVHDVAEGYLYSAHMMQHLLLTLVAALLLVVGTPAWMARRLLSSPGLRVVRWLTRPVFGLIQFNLVLVLSHWPVVVEATVRHHPLHFVAHAVLFISGHPHVAAHRQPAARDPPSDAAGADALPVPADDRAHGAGVVPHLQRQPLYRIYATFPRLWGISALTDQQTAGLIMKIVGGLYLWLVIAVIFFRWYERRRVGTGSA